MKVPAHPNVPDVTVAGPPASATNTTTTNEVPPLEPLEPALPPGLGESSTAPTPHPPIPSAPSSPSLVTTPLVDSNPPVSQKVASLDSYPGHSDSSTASPSTPSRIHGGLFHSLRNSPSSSKIRPSTSDKVVSGSSRSTAGDVPPVPLVPQQHINGQDSKGKEKGKDKGGEKEREEECSSKEFDLRSSLWFKRQNAKPSKDDREREKEKDVKGKEKDTSSIPARAAVPAPATVLSMSRPSPQCRAVKNE